MPLKRINHPSHARYLTFSTFRQTAIFDNSEIRDAFADQLRTAREKHAVLLYAWVIMPDHIHLLVREPKTGDLEPFLRTLKTGFAKRMLANWRETRPNFINELTSPKGHTRFWQRGGGYDRNIISDEEFTEKTDYIHMNPVKAGLVRSPTDWAWSSARWWTGDRDGQIPCDYR